MDIVSELVLTSVAAMNGVSGYCPTIGDIANVANVSYGVATRRLEKLCGLGMIETHGYKKGRVRYRFYPTTEAYIFLNSKRKGL